MHSVDISSLTMNDSHSPVDFLNSSVKDVSSLSSLKSLYDSLKEEQKRLQDEVCCHIYCAIFSLIIADILIVHFEYTLFYWYIAI